MGGTNGTPVLIAAMLVLGGIGGVGLVTADDFESATDGDLSNGEEIRAAEDDDDQAYPINYTFRLRNHQPGTQDGYAEHYAVGLTENGTLHRVLLISEGIGFSDCEPGNTGAFGIDRGNDDPGTRTQFSLLSAFKSYESGEDYINISFYKEETLAGEPVNGSVYDQIVATQRDCYDNPSEPGWYRINGTITGNVAGGTDTDYVVRDLSNWIYICDCDSRAEAEQQLGPPPGEGGSTAADDGGTAETSTAAATTTPPPADDVTATPTATDAATAEGTATVTPGRTTTDTAARTPTDTASGGGSESDAEATSATGTAQDSAGGDAATATATAGPEEMRAEADQPTTPTVGAGPGFGVVATLLGALLAVALIRREIR